MSRKTISLESNPANDDYFIVIKDGNGNQAKLELEREDIAALMNVLWSAGVRPTPSADMRESLANNQVMKRLREAAHG